MLAKLHFDIPPHLDSVDELGHLGDDVLVLLSLEKKISMSSPS